MNARYRSLVYQLLDVGKNAVARSLWKIRREVTSGCASETSRTSWDKVDLTDATKLVDREAEAGILEYLEQQLKGGLHLPYFVSTEEEGTIKVLDYSEASELDLVVFIDPVDFTESVARGLDGSSLITFYSLRHERVLAAVVGDVREQKIYFASENFDRAFSQYVEYLVQPENARANRITDDTQFRFSSTFKQLEPSTVRTISKAHVNCLLNKPERMEALFLRPQLLDRMKPDGRFYVVGGSLGLARVAAGILDGAIEFAKGFREWDAWPGIYICHKAGAFVCDLHGNPIPCRLNATRSKIKERLEKPQRQQFIAAGSSILGRALVGLKLHKVGARRRAA